jgi:hypothetical protein
MRRFLVRGAALLTLLLAGGSARADFIFRFADAGGTPQTSFTINGAGGTVDVRVYLEETNGGTVLSTEKLGSAGVRLDNSATGVARVAAAGDVTGNPSFDDTDVVTVGPDFASLNDAVSANPPLSPDANNRILIGTFRFTGQSVGQFTVTTRDPHPELGFDDTLTGADTALDALIQNSGAVVTVVPEPGSLLLTGLAATAIAAVAYRRSRRVKAARERGS